MQQNQTRYSPLAIAIFSVIAACGIALAVGYGPGDDNGWYLYIAERILAGDRLYADLVEVNPPLVVWMTMPAAAASTALGLPSADVFVIWTSVIVGGSLALAIWVLSRQPKLSARDRCGVIAVAAALLFVLPAENFGQREHFALALMLPYLALSAGDLGDTSIQGPWSRALIGALAGFGASYKPHFLLVALLLECHLVYRRRQVRVVLRRDLLVMTAVVCTYALSVPLVAPEFLSLAQTWSRAYLRFSTLPRLAIALSPVTLLVVIGAVFAAMPRPKAYLGNLQRVWAISAVGFLLAALVQAKGFGHHLYPALACGVLAITTALPRAATLWSAMPASPTAMRAAAVVVGMVAVAGAVQRSAIVSWTVWRDRAENIPKFMAHLEPLHGRGNILFLSGDMMPAFPLVNYSGVRWGMRYPSLWMLREHYRTSCAASGSRSGRTAVRRAPNLDVEEQLVFRHLVEDMRRTRPDLIFIAERPHGAWAESSRCRGFSDYLSRSPAIEEQLARYASIARVGAYDVYALRDTGARGVETSAAVKR